MKGFIDHDLGSGSIGYLYRFTWGNRATFSVSRDAAVKGGEPFGVARVGRSVGWNSYKLTKLTGAEETAALEELERIGP